MKRLQGWSEFDRERGCCLSIGNFDGVHRGHRIILDELVRQARDQRLAAVVLTFEPHPMTLLRPGHAPPRLTTADSKAALLAELGVDTLIEFPPDRTFLQLTAAEFFQHIVVEQLAARSLVEGPNFFYGRNRGGTVDTLREACRQRGLTLTVVEPAASGPGLVSSSRIREALTNGDVATANDMLGREYALTGVVSAGAGRGRTIGFPTANLEGIETLLPADGVYGGRCAISGRKYLAAIHIGPNPTFGEGRRKVEVHLLDFDGDLYSQTLTVAIARRIRGLRSFADAAALREQLMRDVEAIRAGAGASF